MVARAMPMPSLWARPMKRGLAWWRTTARGRELKDIYAPVDIAGKRAQAFAQAISHHPLGHHRSRAVQSRTQVGQALAAKNRRGLGHLPHHPDRRSGRGCPYGCEFCTVTGFFGDSIRFRTNESVVNELLLLKARAKKELGQIAVFFIDDNFAINLKRTKSLLRDIIAAGAQVNWVAQISANLLRDQELVDLIAASGGKWVFIGMESIDPTNLKDVNKGFNKPEEYAAVLERLAQRNVYAITSFIFGMDNDTVGAAERTLAQVRTWPPGLPIFGLLTPLPGTPLYKRLDDTGRLTRRKHWQEFIPFAMAHTPLKMTIDEAHAEVRYGWSHAYSGEAIGQAVDSLGDQPLGYRINILIARLCFRGIYFPMLGRFAWWKVLSENRRMIFKLGSQGFQAWWNSKSRPEPAPAPIAGD